jgi:hypothetical protein
MRVDRVCGRCAGLYGVFLIDQEKQMKRLLVACEYSGRVREAYRQRKEHRNTNCGLRVTWRVLARTDGKNGQEPTKV